MNASGLQSCVTFFSGMEDEICPYATFHLLGFREEMDPSKALNFQTFPHQNGMGGPAHVGTMGPNGPMPHHMHSRSGSQSMVSVLLLSIECFALNVQIMFNLLCFVFHIKKHHPPIFILIRNIINHTPTTLAHSLLLLMLLLVVHRRNAETRLLNLLPWLATSTEPLCPEEQPRWPELHLHSGARVRRPC